MSLASYSVKLIRFGVYEVDPQAGELRKQGRRIKLQDQPFQILVVLLNHRGQVVSREDLRHRLWPGDTFVDFDHGLNTAIMRLREAIGDSSDNPRFIETIPSADTASLLPSRKLPLPSPKGPRKSQPLRARRVRTCWSGRFQVVKKRLRSPRVQQHGKTL